MVQLAPAKSTDAADRCGECYRLIEPVELAHPLWHYFELFRRDAYAFLLDSALPSNRLGKFSFVGGAPHLAIRARRLNGGDIDAPATIEFVDPHVEDSRINKTKIVPGRDVFEVVRKLIEEYRPIEQLAGERPMPLLAGAVGYIGYESAHFLENLPDAGKDDLGLPDLQLMFCDAVLGYCHTKSTGYLSVVGRGISDLAARRQAEMVRDGWLRRIERFERQPLAPFELETFQKHDLDEIDTTGHFDETSYCEAVRRIKQHICSGDIYQACMTHRLSAPLAGHDSWKLYQILRELNPAPFAGMLKFPGLEVISASPERFLSLNQHGVAESRPIKGTRPRGTTPASDAALCAELQSSEKDCAENVMIVDLVRNDFGRVCEFGSVEVAELMAIEPYATVFQMVSTIRGKLRDGHDAIDLIKACFPGGSMTGAPKIEAMKIINRLEPVDRSVYSGAIGYLDFDGPMDWNIVIRSLIVQDGVCHFNVGGAVVADSDPKAEYQETMDKALALKQTLALLKQVTSSRP